MSTITKKWSIERIRDVIQKLDEKTSLSGADLNIVFEELNENKKRKRIKTLGYYNRFLNEFGFEITFFNNPKVKESEVIDVIRHEYAHYYDDVIPLYKYINNSKDKSHGETWKWACKMVGAKPSKHAYCPALPNYRAFNMVTKKWYFEEYEAEEEKEIEYLFNAEDIPKLDINSYIEKWDQLPVSPKVGSRALDYIKETNPNSYYEINDNVLHPKFGFGKVIETVPCNFITQKMLVEFEDKTRNVFEAKDLLKMIDGCAYPYRPVLNLVEEEVMLSH